MRKESNCNIFGKTAWGKLTMAKQRHVEIAGAGIAGLTLGTALAQRGWSVSIRERGAELRELGVGIGLWRNGFEVLENIRVLGKIANLGSKIERWKMLDEQQRVINDVRSGVMVMLRTQLHRALVDEAKRAGVSIETSSSVVAADPSGALTLEGGQLLRADFVAGADGYHSKVRDSLGLAEKVDIVSSSYVGRTVVPRAEKEKEEFGCENWSGPRRFGVMTCGSEYLNLFLSSPENPQEVETQSIDKDLWSRSFPHWKGVFARISESEPVRWDRYTFVKCRAWSSGRAAVLGDAAHAMPATVAQGAGFALTDALSLAIAVDRSGDDLREALRRWEARQRAVIDVTQRFAILLVMLSKFWPANLLDLRTEIVAGILRSREVEQQMMLASRHSVSETQAAPAQP
jgi:2-polyprenyl-6-methoxyphenol hydroxylase-like FAD-dependent oxidoreductase